MKIASVLNACSQALPTLLSHNVHCVLKTGKVLGTKLLLHYGSSCIRFTFHNPGPSYELEAML